MAEGTDWVEQARRLVAGLGETGLGQAVFGPAGTGAGGPFPAGEHEPGGDCRWCPVCQLAAVARRPEVSEALADALTSAATALRAFAAAAAAEAPGPDPAATEDETAGREPAPPTAPVQHIEIA
nr:hypothetical protein [uncultured bacterium]